MSTPKLFTIPLLVLAPSPLLAQTCEVQLLASDGAGNDRYGTAVDLVGDVAICTADDEDGLSGGLDFGAVYVHTRNAGTGEWTETDRLQPATLVDRSHFGRAIDRDADRLVVGAPGVSGTFQFGPGEAYVYSTTDGGSTWSLDATLSASDGAVGDLFGDDVAMDDDLILVGAPGNDEDGTDAGAVYVFAFNGSAWVEVDKVLPPASVGGRGFGESIDVDGGLACLGGSRLAGSVNSGTVAGYTVSGSTLTFLELVEPAGLGLADFYGMALSLNSGVLVVGSPFDDDVAGNAGAAYVFEYDAMGTTFAFETKLAPTTLGAQAHFGDSCENDGATLVVGAPDPAGGGAWAYRESGGSWSELRFVRPGLASASGNVGESLSIDGDVLLLGDSSDGTINFQAGAAYVVDVSDLDTNGNGVSDICEDWSTIYCAPAITNSTGNPASIEATGSPFASDQLLVLTTTDLPNFAFGYYLGSETQSLIVGPGGSQGNLCLGGTIGRFISQVTDSGPNGQISVQIDIGALPPPLPNAVMAGETWNFQLWYRDANPNVTSNFSDAVSIDYL